jgi:glycosyltransferase involved in cell wall biosynthesis
LKVAVIHDWLVTYGGADRVLEQILACYPEADLFSLVDFLPSNLRYFVLGKKAQTSFIQNLPFSRRLFRAYLPFMPLAVEQFDLSAYDLVLSSSHCVAKGVITGPDQLHICYCHSPMRYVWDLQNEYLREAGLDHGLKSWVSRWLFYRTRTWDVRTAFGVDEFIANSEFVARRIWKTYRREATVIYPPVDTDRLAINKQKDDFYLTVSRLVPYKRVSLIVEAFRMMPDKKLIVIGDGPQFKSIAAKAKSNVAMLGFQDFDVVRDHLQRARGFIFAAEEDFGICLAEAQACGTPVLAFAKGGALEIVRETNQDDLTGQFFQEQTPEAIVNAVRRFEDLPSNILADSCRRNALRFSIPRFRAEFVEFCENALLRKRGGNASHDRIVASVLNHADRSYI